MARTFLISALTAGLMAASAGAHAETSVVVKFGGRSHAQIVADVASAARLVCAADPAAPSVSSELGNRDDCISDTVSVTLNRIASLQGR